MTMHLLGEDLERGIWAALSVRTPMTLDDLQIVSGFEPWRILRYLDLLVSNGYVRMSGVQKAFGGESVPQFTLIRREGPLAPYADPEGRCIDPNMIAPTVNSARIRFVAEQLPQPFSRWELAEAVGITTATERQFKSFWDAMRFRKHIVPEGQRFRYVPPPVAQALREVLRANPGREMTGSEVIAAAAIGDRRRASGNAFRLAVALIEAEGYRVTVRRVGPRQTIYRVEAPGGITTDDADYTDASPSPQPSPGGRGSASPLEAGAQDSQIPEFPGSGSETSAASADESEQRPACMATEHWDVKFPEDPPLDLPQDDPGGEIPEGDES